MRPHLDASLATYLRAKGASVYIRDTMAVQNSAEDALKFAVALVQTGVSSARDEKGRYEYITKRLLDAPFFTLERSTTDTRKWSNQKVTVEDALKKFLPEDAYTKLIKKSRVDDMQSVMDLHTFKDFRTKIWTNQVSGSKEVMDMIHISEPDPVTSKLSVYFIRLYAEYEGTRSGLRRQETRNLTAEYRYMDFTALTSILKEIKQRKESDIVAKSLEHLSLDQ